MSKILRLLPLEKPTDPLENMALDEMLLEKVSQGMPTLRFYRWEGEAYSVGYFQDVKRVAQAFHCQKRGISVVRRVTGGGLVHHGKDLTLSLVLPERNAFLPERVTDAYRKIHEVLKEGLQDLVPGVHFTKAQRGFQPRSTRLCFEEPTCFDLGLADKKIAGSSQRRRGGGLLHQSALFLPVDPMEGALAIQASFQKLWEIKFEVSSLGSEEIARVRELIHEKYSRPEFSFQPNFQETSLFS